MNDLRRQRLRLDRLMRLRQQAVIQIEQQLVQLVQQRRRERNKLKRMHQQLQDLLKQPPTSPQVSSPSIWEANLKYATHLRSQIMQQDQVVSQLKSRWQEIRERHAQLKAKANSMEMLLHRHAEHLRAEEIKKEQKYLDEMMLVRRHRERA